MALDRFRDGAFDGVGVRDVHGDGVDALGDRVDPEVEDDRGTAGLGDGGDDGRAESGGAAGDEIGRAHV